MLVVVGDAKTEGESSACKSLVEMEHSIEVYLAILFLAADLALAAPNKVGSQKHYDRQELLLHTLIMIQG